MARTKEEKLEQFIGWAKQAFKRVEYSSAGMAILAKLDHSAVEEVLEEALLVPYRLGRNRDYASCQRAAQFALTVTAGVSSGLDKAERVQALLFATHIASQEAKLQNRMFEGSESEIVWATIAALAEYLGLDGDVAKAIALGYDSMYEYEQQNPKHAGAEAPKDTAPLVAAAKELFRARVREDNAADLLCVLNESLDDAPEYVRPLVDRLKEHFPGVPPLTIKFIFTGLLASACLDGNHGYTSTFSYKKDAGDDE